MQKTETKIKVALTDDHILMRNALADMIDNFGNCKVIHQSDNGQELIDAVVEGMSPDIVILDQNMPTMDGLDAARWLTKNYPQINILMLSMYDSEFSLVRLLRYGVRGFLKKNIHPSELKFAIESVIESGSYYCNYTTGKILDLFRNNSAGQMRLEETMLTEQEISFLKLISMEMTYKSIAEKMGLNPRTIDTVRDQLFIKFDVRSRVGLVMLAVRHGIATI